MKNSFQSRNKTILNIKSQKHQYTAYSMYTKAELESMDIPQLMGIADQLGIKVSPDDELESVVYSILDKAAEESAANATAAPKEREHAL